MGSIGSEVFGDIGIIDLLFTTPRVGDHVAGYMFKDTPEGAAEEPDFVAYLIAEMDRFGIAQGLLPVAQGDRWGTRAIREHPRRLFGFHLVDPNRGVDAVRSLRHAVEHLGAVSAASFPSGTTPQVTIADPLMYVIYAACVEMDIPIFINVGVPGPRSPMATQHVEHLDRVCYDFPDLKIITRHGGEPWDALLVKLMLKWPNLYYSTSAFAPKHYPKTIIDYANTRGAHKIMYAGYFPSGLSLERIMAELPNVAFNDDVWPRFLRDNAREVLRLPDPPAAAF